MSAGGPKMAHEELAATFPMEMYEMDTNEMGTNEMDTNEMDMDNIPPNIKTTIDEAKKQLMPQKSKIKYEGAYNAFMKWMTTNNLKTIEEDVVLAYFHLQAQKYKPSSVWATYSMLRSVIHLKHNINIHDYGSLISYLKNNSKGFTPVKAKVLEPEHIEKFINEAPDRIYLAVKVATIFGVQGACRRNELTNISMNDIIDKQDMAIINIPVTKNDKPRSFILNQEYYNIYKKYADLRPPGIETNRFFIQYHNGHCKRQVIGINSFGKMPSQIAEYLGLEMPQKYTGHTFRRTSATLLANAGADLLTLKRHGGWKSSSVAEGYVEDSLRNKQKISDMITTSIKRPTISTRTPLSTINSNQHLFAATTAAASTSSKAHIIPETQTTSIITDVHEEDDSSQHTKTETKTTIEEKQHKTNMTFTNCSDLTIILENYKTNET